MRMALSALEQLRAEQPYWNASGGADHIFLFSHDEGACWAPHEIARKAILLTHWGRMDLNKDSSSRYPQATLTLTLSLTLTQTQTQTLTPTLPPPLPQP